MYILITINSGLKQRVGYISLNAFYLCKQFSYYSTKQIWIGTVDLFWDWFQYSLFLPILRENENIKKKYITITTKILIYKYIF